MLNGFSCHDVILRNFYQWYVKNFTPTNFSKYHDTIQYQKSQIPLLCHSQLIYITTEQIQLLPYFFITRFSALSYLSWCVINLLAFCAGNPPVTGGFPSQSLWRGTLIFSFICNWTNGWENSPDAGVLTRHRAHHDVTLMIARKLISNSLFVPHSKTCHMNTFKHPLSITPSTISLIWTHFWTRTALMRYVRIYML